MQITEYHTLHSMSKRNHFGLSTRSISAGEDQDSDYQPVAPDMVLSTSFIADYGASFSIEGRHDDALPFFYTRWGNPTIRQLEEKLAQVEGTEGCVAFGSGMAAVTSLFLFELQAGDRVVMSDVCYAAVSEAAGDLYPGLGIEIVKVNMADPERLREALTPETKLVYTETPCNPLMRLTDLELVVKEARKVNAKVATDSTFASPAATRPAELGVDYVVHSLTKYINGHGDAMGGAILGTSEAMEQIRKKILIKTGGVISPFNAWLIMRGMATFPLRMKKHTENALAVASMLEKHPAVKKVFYPGLPSHPQFELAQRQMETPSGMLTFQVEEGERAARLMAQQLEVIRYAVSLGHQHSLIYYLPTDEMLESTFILTAEQEKSYREYAGKGIFRLSAGLEDIEDIERDLAHVLDKL